MATYALLTDAIAANGAPTLVTHGVELRTGLAPPEGDHMFLLRSTAGSGTMTVAVRLWGYYSTLAAWSPIGTGPITTRGYVNAGVTLGETEADKIAFSEVLKENVWGLRACDRIYAEITAIGGAASTAVSAVMVTV